MSSQDNEILLANNCFLKFDLSPTATWGSSGIPILSDLCKQIMREYRFRTIQLRGVLHGLGLAFYNTVKDSNVPYSLFMQNSTEFDYKQMDHTVELIELIGYIDGDDPSPLNPVNEYILQEDGSKIILEDNTGYILTENNT